MSLIQDMLYKYVNKCQSIVDNDVNNSKVLLQGIQYHETIVENNMTMLERTIINKCYNKHTELDIELCDDINRGIHPVRELLFINDSVNKMFISCRKI